MSIIIVSIEDEKEITELLSIVLKSPGVEIVESNLASEGLELVRTLHPALVIVDIVLPDMDGWLVYDAIRADPEISGTPIIMLTGLRREFQTRRLFRNSPIDIYLTKPFDTLQLRRQIETMLNQQIW
ncbi:MAG: response regulator [Chloroflexota bacterium]